MRGLRILRVALWAAALTGAAVFGLVQGGVIGPGSERRSLPVAPAVAGIGGPFRLTSHTGRTVTDKDLKGKPSAVFFGFTHCPDVCPTTLSDLTDLMRELGPDADKITPVFISVDPERDTQRVLADYMQAFDPRILGLTGTTAEVDLAVQAYKAYYRKGAASSSGGYTVDHTAIVYLMNKEGQMASSLDSHEPREARLAKLRLLVANHR